MISFTFPILKRSTQIEIATVVSWAQKTIDWKYTFATYSLRHQDAVIIIMTEQRVARVFGGAGWYVDTVSLQYANGTVRGYGNTAWNEGKPNKDHHLDVDDFIVSVTQYKYHRYLGAGLVFETNDGHMLEVIGSQCPKAPKILHAPTGHQVVGLRFQGSVLQELDTSLVPAMNGGLQVISVSGGAGWYVDTVTFELSDGTRRGYGNTSWNNGRPNQGPHQIREGEYIVSVKQYFHGQYLGGGLLFETSRGNFFEIAGSQCIRDPKLTHMTKLIAPSGWQVIGLKFTCSSSSLSKLETIPHGGSSRRQWLRAICSVDADDSHGCVSAVFSESKSRPAHDQLIVFFKLFPGLRRLIGAILIMYYNPNVAGEFSSKERKCAIS